MYVYNYGIYVRVYVYRHGLYVNIYISKFGYICLVCLCKININVEQTIEVTACTAFTA